jgi:hypothetical protein
MASQSSLMVLLPWAVGIATAGLPPGILPTNPAGLKTHQTAIRSSSNIPTTSAAQRARLQGREVLQVILWQGGKGIHFASPLKLVSDKSTSKHPLQDLAEGREEIILRAGIILRMAQDIAQQSVSTPEGAEKLRRQGNLMWARWDELMKKLWNTAPKPPM